MGHCQYLCTGKVKTVLHCGRWPYLDTYGTHLLGWQDEAARKGADLQVECILFEGNRITVIHHQVAIRIRRRIAECKGYPDLLRLLRIVGDI
ncbi:MAG: hypothetical protein WC605_13955, partial [Bacteroidales bacterium]